MSDTTGWGRDNGEYSKTIYSTRFEIFQTDGGWHLYLRPVGAPSFYCATRPTLRECQQLAHATARLWAGDTE